MNASVSKEFADNNFRFDKNGRQVSKWVENIVGKGEIARYKQFLLLPHHFQKTFTAYRACLGKGSTCYQMFQSFNYPS